MPSKFTRSAKGRECQVRIPTVCNFNPETTVLAHLNGGGMGMKHDDIHGAFCCSDCHDVVDGKVHTAFNYTEVKLMHLEGVIRTQKIWMDEGLM